jgi:hypothetical protein
VLSSHVLSSYVLSSYVLSSNVLSSNVLSSHVLSSYVLSSNVLSSYVLSSYVLSSYVLSSCVLSSFLRLCSHIGAALGGGDKCRKCGKTVYLAERVGFDGQYYVSIRSFFRFFVCSLVHLHIHTYTTTCRRYLSHHFIAHKHTRIYTRTYEPQHKLCFRCVSCAMAPTIKNFSTFENKVYCKSCCR